MCGIIGYVGNEPAGPIVLEGLRLLESRGYDSAGIASINSIGELVSCRSTGKLERLVTKLDNFPIHGKIALGHNRWATHGKVTEENAHPHISGVNGKAVAVVHNGIIENYLELRKELARAGRQCMSETDTEVVPHAIAMHLENGDDVFTATRKAVQSLKGSFALGILFSQDSDLLVGVRYKQPLVVGIGPYGAMLSSSELALSPATSHVTYLEDGDMAVVRTGGVLIYDAAGKSVVRNWKPFGLRNTIVSKGNYRHYLLKEIEEQPVAIADTFRSLSDPNTHGILLPELPFDFRTLPRLSIVGCGTAAYAGYVGSYFFEDLARLPVDVSIASEFRYREPVLPLNQAGLFISQSGETADTLAALEYMKKNGNPTLAIVNVPESNMTRLADKVIYTHAYPEISVGSTKAFTTQLSVLLSLAFGAGCARNSLTGVRVFSLLRAMNQLPADIEKVFSLEKELEAVACELSEANHIFYVGRGASSCIALEGALKMKELSYIHAEGYPAGELKHGPLALIDRLVPTIAIAPHDKHFDKVASNLQEIGTRNGKVILLSDKTGCQKLAGEVYKTICLPTVDPIVAPILYAVAVQLLAYYTAVEKGTDVDNPRNLAKSVTVE